MTEFTSNFTYKIHTSLTDILAESDQYLLLYYSISKNPIIDNKYIIHIDKVSSVEIKYLSYFIEYIYRFTALVMNIDENIMLSHCLYQEPISFQNMKGSRYRWLDIDIFVEKSNLKKANLVINTIIFLTSSIRCYGEQAGEIKN